MGNADRQRRPGLDRSSRSRPGRRLTVRYREQWLLRRRRQLRYLRPRWLVGHRCSQSDLRWRWQWLPQSCRRHRPTTIRPGGNQWRLGRGRGHCQARGPLCGRRCVACFDRKRYGRRTRIRRCGWRGRTTAGILAAREGQSQGNQNNGCFVPARHGNSRLRNAETHPIIPIVSHWLTGRRQGKLALSDPFTTRETSCTGCKGKVCNNDRETRSRVPARCTHPAKGRIATFNTGKLTLAGNAVRP
jgi:hypothetical protein